MSNNVIGNEPLSVVNTFSSKNQQLGGQERVQSGRQYNKYVLQKQLLKQ